jgi:hypothetical protein
MAEYSDNTRCWLKSVIGQRKMLIRRNASHIDMARALVAINDLEKLLACYSYSNDLFMARFLRQQSQNIEFLLPGKGSSCHERRLTEWNMIKKTAILIAEEQTPKQNIYEPTTESAI